MSHRIEEFLSTIEETICYLPDIRGESSIDILVTQQDRRELIEMLRVVVSLRLPNGKPALDRINRRILYMYVIGFPQRTIAAKVNMNLSAVQRRIKGMPEKILLCKDGSLENLWRFLQPLPSTKVAHAPEVMLGLGIDSSKDSWKVSEWGLTNRKKTWKTKVVCRVPEYFEDCFGDKETHCSICGIQCTRKKYH